MVSKILEIQQVIYDLREVRKQVEDLKEYFFYKDACIEHIDELIKNIYYYGRWQASEGGESIPYYKILKGAGDYEFIDSECLKADEGGES